MTETTATKPKVIGLIAGGRQFPVLVARGVKDAGHRLVVAGFAGFWIERIDQHQATVIGRFLPMKAFGQSGGPAGPTAGPVLKILRLVE